MNAVFSYFHGASDFKRHFRYQNGGGAAKYTSIKQRVGDAQLDAGRRFLLLLHMNAVFPYFHAASVLSAILGIKLALKTADARRSILPSNNV